MNRAPPECRRCASRCTSIPGALLCSVRGQAALREAMRPIHSLSGSHTTRRWLPRLLVKPPRKGGPWPSAGVKSAVILVSSSSAVARPLAVMSSDRARICPSTMKARLIAVASASTSDQAHRAPRCSVTSSLSPSGSWSSNRHASRTCPVTLISSGGFARNVELTIVVLQ